MEFDDPIVGTTELIRAAIQSPNYEAGIAGWIIRKDGTAEFQDIVARGVITADSLDIDQGARGRIHLFYDDFNLRPTMDWLVGADNMTDLGIVGATQTTVGRVVQTAAQVGSGSAGRVSMEVRSGALNSNQQAILRVHSGRSDGSEGPEFDVSLSSAPSDPRGLFTVNQQYDVEIAALRPTTDSLGSSAGRTLTSTTFTSVNALGDVAERTINRPASASVHIAITVQAGITAGQGVIGFEIRDTNSAGTVRFAASDANAAIMSSVVTGANTYVWIDNVFNIAGTSDDLYIRVMYRTTSGGTLTLQRLRLHVTANP